MLMSSGETGFGAGNVGTRECRVAGTFNATIVLNCLIVMIVSVVQMTLRKSCEDYAKHTSVPVQEQYPGGCIGCNRQPLILTAGDVPLSQITIPGLYFYRGILL